MQTGTIERATIQRLATLFGVVFLVVGIAGFIPGITTHYGRLGEFSGTGALALGIFGVNWLENVVHLLYAAAGFGSASTPARSRLYFLGGGAVYLVLWVYGIVIDLSSSANVVGVNPAANWLHFLLGVVMVGIGLVLGGDRALGRRTALSS